MPTIRLETIINADIGVCFDLSRSIDLHIISTAQSKEKAIGGVTSGLIGLDESVTWKAVHFGMSQKLTAVITAYNRPTYFRDQQLKGPFKYFIHDHFFIQRGKSVVMKDVFEFKSPYGFLGRLADKFVLAHYLKKLLLIRNGVIKEYGETNKWKSLLKTCNEI